MFKIKKNDIAATYGSFNLEAFYEYQKRYESSSKNESKKKYNKFNSLKSL